MIWAYRLIAYLIIIIITACIFGFIFHKTLKTKSKNLVALLTLITCMVAILIAGPFLEPYFYACTFQDVATKEYPILKLLADKAPDEFNAYIDKEKRAIRKYGVNENMITFDTIKFLDIEITKYSQIASNQSLYDFMQARLDLFKKLYTENPNIILRLEFPNKYSDATNINVVKFNDLYKKGMLSVENVINSALEHPQTPISDQDKKKALQILKSIGLDLANKYGKETVIQTFENPSSPELNTTVAANIIIKLYENILAKGVDDTGIIVKYVFNTSHTK